MAISPLDAARRLRDAAVDGRLEALNCYRRYVQQVAEFVSRVD